jgi:hypothetical protein
MQQATTRKLISRLHNRCPPCFDKEASARFAQQMPTHLLFLLEVRLDSLHPLLLRLHLHAGLNRSKRMRRFLDVLDPRTFAFAGAQLAMSLNNMYQ